MTRKSSLLFISIVLITGSLFANITGWRTDNTGKYPDADPPLSWNREKNLVWKTPLPSSSNATPVIAGDKIFVCSDTARLICISKNNGKILWQKNTEYKDVLPAEEYKKAQADMKKANEISSKELKPLAAEHKALRKKMHSIRKQIKKEKDAEKKKRLQEQIKPLKKQEKELQKKMRPIHKKITPLRRLAKPKTHKVNGYSSPTPVTDGKHVYVLYCTGVAACYDMEGNRKWARIIEKPAHGWGHSASPVLADGKLIVHIRKLRALNPQTGEEIWSVSHGFSWGTPAVTTINGLTILITPRGQVINPADGKILIKKTGHLSYGTPVIENNSVYFIDEKGGKAIELSREADTLKAKTLWTNKPKRNRYYASSLVHDGLVYAITRGRTFSIIDAADGKIHLSRKLKLKGEPYPSITLAGKHIFVMSDKGTVKVLEPGRKYNEISAFTIGTFRSCPVFEGTRVYVRTYKELLCFEKK